MAPQNHLGRFIRDCRDGLKYTSRKVAALSAERSDLPTISGSYVVAVEKGSHIPRLDKVITLAEILNVPVYRFVEECRRDMGTALEPEAGASWEELLEAGHECRSAGEDVRALGLLKQALRLLGGDDETAGNHDEVRNQICLDIAACYRKLSHPRLARDELEGLLRRRPPDPRLRAQALSDLAAALEASGDVLPALACAEKALAVAQELGDTRLEADLLLLNGHLHFRDRDHEASGRRFREALKLYNKLGEERHASQTRLRLALCDIEMRRYDQATDSLRRLVGAFREWGDTELQAWSELGLAKALYLSDSQRPAKVHANAARELAEQCQHAELTFLALFYLWQMARKAGQGPMAKLYRERLSRCHEQLDTEPPEAEEFISITGADEET